MSAAKTIVLTHNENGIVGTSCETGDGSVSHGLVRFGGLKFTETWTCTLSHGGEKPMLKIWTGYSSVSHLRKVDR